MPQDIQSQPPKRPPRMLRRLTNGRLIEVAQSPPRLFQDRSVGELVRARLHSGAERPSQLQKEE